jgi:hypothetical protein
MLCKPHLQRKEQRKSTIAAAAAVVTESGMELLLATSVFP